MAHDGVPGQRVVSPALVGRATELERAAAAVSGPPAVVVVEGEAGIGKTRLVNELAQRPELAGGRVLVGRCHRIRESFPLGPVIEAVRGLGTGFAGADWSPVVGALRPLLPEVAEELPLAPSPLDERAAERHRVFRALLEVLGSLGPAVLVLEDLHWADEATVDLLGYLLSDVPEGLAVVLTFRDDEVDPRARSLTSSLPAATSRTEISLRPLDVRETGDLAAAIVGADHVSEEFAAYLCERTSGLPLAIEELLALLQARGELVRRGGAWARRTLDELDVPTGIREPVRERTGRLSPAGRAVVQAAAVLQVPFSVGALVATSDVPAAQALPAVEEALESGLLAEHGDAVGFRHLLAAQAVFEEIPGPRRRDLHGRAAVALAAVEPVPLGQVAHHLHHAGRLDEWVGAAERAADQALALGHDAEAFRLLEDVLRHAPLDPDRRGRLAVRLGKAASEALRVGEVLELLSATLDQDLPAGVRGELRFQVGLLMHDIGGDPQRVRALMSDAIADLADYPELQAWAMVVLGIPTAEGVALAEHRRWLDRALTVMDRITDPVFEVFLLGKVAMVLTPIGDPGWRGLTARIEQRAGGEPRHRREVNAYWSVGAQAGYVGDHETAHRMLTTALAGAVAGENRRMELSIRAALVQLRYCRGSWEDLPGEVEVLIEELAEHPRSRIDVEIVAGCLALVGGDLDRAHRELARAVDQCLELGSFDTLAAAIGAMIRAALARGEQAAATAAAQQWLAAVKARGVWAADARALPSVLGALLGDGQAAEGGALVDRCARELSDLDAPLGPAALATSYGLLRQAAGEPEAAAAHFVEAAGRYEGLSCPYEAALAAEQVAVCRFATGAPGAAETALREALAGLQHLDATWDLRRVTSLARQHGVSLPARHRGGRRGYGNQLSPREREVAELAAVGHSNKEIAAELYLSVNTVGRHISAAMRKLDARSRTALAHRLADQRADQN